MRRAALDGRPTSQRVTAQVHQGAIDVLGPVTDPQTVHQSKFSMGTVLGMVAAARPRRPGRVRRALPRPAAVAAFRDKVQMELDAEVDAAYPARWIGKVQRRHARTAARSHGARRRTQGRPRQHADAAPSSRTRRCAWRGYRRRRRARRRCGRWPRGVGDGRRTRGDAPSVPEPPGMRDRRDRSTRRGCGFGRRRCGSGRWHDGRRNPTRRDRDRPSRPSGADHHRCTGVHRFLHARARHAAGDLRRRTAGAALRQPEDQHPPPRP